MENIKEDIKCFIKTELVKDDTDVELSDDQSLLDSGIVDSMGIMKMLSYIEEKFNISVNGDELLPENFENIHCIANLIKKKMTN